MITILCVILGILISLLIISVGVFLEKRDFNNGICPDCGATLRFFDTDSQGGRGYCYDNCLYHTWVSYDTVDKKFREVRNNDKN